MRGTDERHLYRSLLDMDSVLVERGVGPWDLTSYSAEMFTVFELHY